MYEVTGVFELDEITGDSGEDPLRFRIELIRSRGTPPSFFARLYRWETFRVRPSFGHAGPEGEADAEMLVTDLFWDWQANPAPEPKAALDALLARLRDQLPGTGIPETAELLLGDQDK